MLFKHLPTRKDKGTTVIMWDSVAEPMALTDAYQWQQSVNKHECERHTTRGPVTSNPEGWLGAPSLAVMQERLKRGWPEGVTKLEKLATKELESPQSVRRRRFRGDQGDEVDMQAVWRGDMSRAWTRTRRANRSAVRSVSIVIDLGAACNVTADRLFWRGASALKLAEILTVAGYNVAIYGAAASADCATTGSLNSVQFVEIKAEDSPMDMDKLAALTAMPGFFRTSLFRGIVYSADRFGSHVEGALGRADSELIAKHVKDVPIPQNAFIQPKNVLDKASAEAWIDTVLDIIQTPELQAA